MAVPTDDQFYDKTDPTKPSIAFLKNHLYREGRLTEEQAMFILNRGAEVLRKEPNLLDVESPVTVCGDVHGQFVSLSGAEGKEMEEEWRQRDGATLARSSSHYAFFLFGCSST